MTRLNWSNSRQSPTDQDDITPSEIDYRFDYRRCTEPGKPSWPEKHSGQKFGPSFIKKAWQKGLVVVADVGLPHPVAAMDVQWAASGVLQVRCAEGWRVPDRIWTRDTVKGLTSTGLLIEERDVE